MQAAWLYGLRAACQELEGHCVELDICKQSLLNQAQAIQSLADQVGVLNNKYTNLVCQVLGCLCLVEPWRSTLNVVSYRYSSESSENEINLGLREGRIEGTNRARVMFLCLSRYYLNEETALPKVRKNVYERFWRPQRKTWESITWHVLPQPIGVSHREAAAFSYKISVHGTIFIVKEVSKRSDVDSNFVVVLQ